MRIAMVHRSRLSALSVEGPVELTLPVHTNTGDFAVGDWVLVDPRPRLLHRRLNRRTVPERRVEGSRTLQPAAANVDTLFIVTSCNADFNQARLERYLALANQAGTIIDRCERHHRSAEFRAFLDQVEQSVAPDLEVHRVLDNLKTYKTTVVHDWLVQHPRFHLHFRPTSASWLNLVECWFSVLTRRRLERGAFTSTEDLEAAICDYIAETNAHPKPFVWTKSADAILANVAHFCKQTSNSNH